MSDPRQKTRERLRAAGLRATSQRLLVLQVLSEADSHLDAGEICARAQRTNGNISLATVYRTLDTLKEIGLVRGRYFARDHRREYYEAANRQEHCHFVCVNCGKVIKVYVPGMAQVRQELGSELGLVFTYTCVCFEGYCPDCASSYQVEDSDRRNLLTI